MMKRLWPLWVLLIATPLGAVDLRQATFTQVIKDVTVVSSGTNKSTAKAKLNDMFINPDIVQTGPDSLAELIAEDKTVTRIGANTIFSFGAKGREVNLVEGSVLFHSPKGKGGGTIKTKAASASVLGTTIVVTATVGGGFKAIVLEGKGQITLPNGDFRILTAGQVTFVLPGSRAFGPQLNINLQKLVESSRLVQGFEQELPSKPIIQNAIDLQQVLIRNGVAEDTKILVANQATENTVTTVDSTVLEQAVEPPRDRLTLAKAADLTINTSDLTESAYAPNSFSDPVSFGIPILGPNSARGIVGKNITITTTAINFWPFRNQIEFVIGATEKLLIDTPSLTLTLVPPMTPQDLTPQSVSSLLQEVILAAKLGIDIRPGACITANAIGGLHFFTDGKMDLQAVIIQNYDGGVALNAGDGLTMHGGGVNAPFVSLQGPTVNLTGNASFISSSGLVASSAYGTDLTVDGAAISALVANLSANRDAFLDSLAADSFISLDVNAQRNLTVTGGSLTGRQGGQASAAVQLTAGDTLTLNHPLFTDVASISLSAGTVSLNDVVFPTTAGVTVLATHQVNLGSQLDTMVTTGAYTVSGAGGSVQASAPRDLFTSSGVGLTATAIQLSATRSATLTGLSATGDASVGATAGQDLTVSGGSLNASAANGSVQLTAGQSLSLSGATLGGHTIQTAGNSIDLDNLTTTATASATATAVQDLHVNGGSLAVSGLTGTAQLTAGRDFTAVGGAQIEASTIQVTAANNATLNNVQARGFNTLNVSAIANLNVSGGSFTGTALAQSATATLTAGDTLTVNGPTLANVTSISLFARTVNLSNINFPNGSMVNLQSQHGQLAPNPNTGAASVPGYVNFIVNVNYNGNPAQSYIGGPITISQLPTR